MAYHHSHFNNSKQLLKCERRFSDELTAVVHDVVWAHSVANGEKSDRDQPLPSRYHGGRRCGLLVLGASAGDAVPHLRAPEQRADLGAAQKSSATARET